MSRLWVFLHLLFLSAEDMRDGSLSFAVLLELLITGFIRDQWCGEPVLWMPGVFLMLAGKLSGEVIGMGDGWLILALGMWLSYKELLQILLTGVLLGTCFGICRGTREIPLVPFLTIGFVLTTGG